jgi:ATP-dependent DNA ligase
METDIVARGGEGICLRHKDETYRPNNFLKIKRLFPDLDRWQG